MTNIGARQGTPLVLHRTNVATRPKTAPRLRLAKPAAPAAPKKRRQVRFVLRYQAGDAVPAAVLDRLRALKGLVIDAHHGNLFLVHGPRCVADFDALMTELPGFAVAQEQFYRLAND